MDIKIIYEDKYVICLDKPQGVPSQSDKTDDLDLMTQIADYLKDKGEGPYLGLIQRLDRPVGGVIVYAKTEFANKELSKQIQLRQMNKSYLTVVCGTPPNPEGFLEDYIKKLRTINMSKISTEDDKQAKLGKLKYKVIQTEETEEYGALTLVWVELYTGRHHQIRVQLSNANMPIWGDNKYNKVFVKKKDWTQIALFSYKIGFKHPKTKKYMEFESIPGDIYPFKLFKGDIKQ